VPPLSVVLEIGAGHPALAGHFPGRPVVPGVVLLDHATRAALAVRPGHRLAGIPRAKFLHPVGPAEPVTIELHGRDDRRVDVIGTLPSGLVAFRATLILEPCAPEASG
jgi:3-hydroxyacyl-[acyl-carrier-protein] dehydratase